jgi:hypothetical protein
MYRSVKSVFVPIMAPSRLPLLQGHWTICWWGDKIYLLTFLFNTSASDDTIHLHWLRLYSVRTAKLYFYKKEIVSFIEKYSTPWNVVTQPGEYMNVGLFDAGLFHINANNAGHISEILYFYRPSYLVRNGQLTCYYM